MSEKRKTLEYAEKLINGTQEEQLQVIEDFTRERLKMLLGGINYVPEELAYIVTEVSIRRFNRIGSEGTVSHNVEGEQMAWNTDDDFAPYANDLANYREYMGTQKVVRFL